MSKRSADRHTPRRQRRDTPVEESSSESAAAAGGECEPAALPRAGSGVFPARRPSFATRDGLVSKPHPPFCSRACGCEGARAGRPHLRAHGSPGPQGSTCRTFTTGGEPPVSSVAPSVPLPSASSICGAGGRGRGRGSKGSSGRDAGTQCNGRAAEGAHRRPTPSRGSLRNRPPPAPVRQNTRTRTTTAHSRRAGPTDMTDGQPECLGKCRWTCPHGVDSISRPMASWPMTGTRSLLSR